MDILCILCFEWIVILRNYRWTFWWHLWNVFDFRRIIRSFAIFTQIFQSQIFRFYRWYRLSIFCWLGLFLSFTLAARKCDYFDTLKSKRVTQEEVQAALMVKFELEKVKIVFTNFINCFEKSGDGVRSNFINRINNLYFFILIGLFR